MKHVLFLLLTTLVFSYTSQAQGNGKAYVLNYTDCDVYADIVAVCDDCDPPTEFSSQSMQLVPHHGWPGVLLYDPNNPSAYWFGGSGPGTICNDGNWQWCHANIAIDCGGFISNYTVGNPSGGPCGHAHDVEEILPEGCWDDCFGGTRLRIKWYPNNGGTTDLIVTIGY